MSANRNGYIAYLENILAIAPSRRPAHRLCRYAQWSQGTKRTIWVRVGAISDVLRQKRPSPGLQKACTATM